MRTTITIKHKPVAISFGLKQKSLKDDYTRKYDTKSVKFGKKSISFGRKSYGHGESTLTDHRSKNRIDDKRMQGKHETCKNCDGCGKGNSCPIL